jgi:hypothetical protein
VCNIAQIPSLTPFGSLQSNATATAVLCIEHGSCKSLAFANAATVDPVKEPCFLATRTLQSPAWTMSISHAHNVRFGGDDASSRGSAYRLNIYSD